MATNGNDPQIEALENTLRKAGMGVNREMLPVTPPVQAEQTTETYDAMMRGRDTVLMLRDMARYNNEVADAIERTMTVWHGHTSRLMGQK